MKKLSVATVVALIIFSTTTLLIWLLGVWVATLSILNIRKSKIVLNIPSSAKRDIVFLWFRLPELREIPVAPGASPPSKTSLSVVGVATATPSSEKKAFESVEDASGGDEVSCKSGLFVIIGSDGCWLVFCWSFSTTNSFLLIKLFNHKLPYYMKKITYSIIIPAYAEEAFIGKTLKALSKYLKSQKIYDDTEVIVVTSDAQDKTQSIVKNSAKLFAHFTQLQPGPKVGKGRDVRAGLAKARGKYVLFMDADMATPLHHIAEAFDLLKANGGIVIGQRNLTTMHKTFLRRLSSLMSNTFIKLIVGFDIHDSQCGFKGFTNVALGIILPRMTLNGWSFDVEMIKIAKIHGFAVSKLPVPDWEDPKGPDAGLAGENVIVAMLKSLRETINMQINSWLHKYD